VNIAMQPIDLHGTSIIGYRRGQRGGRRLRAFDPSTAERLEPEFHSASLDDVNDALRLATAAFGTYRALPGIDRAAFLRGIALGLEAHADQIANRVYAETGLPVARGSSELGRTCHQLRMFADLAEEGSWVDARIDRPDPNRKPSPKPDVRSLLVPLGPVAVFCASNFPLAFSVAGGDTASALAAGNPVVVNAHYAHPGTAELVGTIIRDVAEERGLPEGVFSLLITDGQEVGQYLVRHPDLRAVGFTGSRRGGKMLVDIAASRDVPIPVFAEMSSVNPVVVLPGAMSARGAKIAEGLFASVTLGAGQFCTNPGLVFIPAGDLSSSFVDTLARLTTSSGGFTMLHEGIRENYRKHVEGRRKHAELIAMGKAEKGALLTTAAVYRITAQEFIAREEFQEEIFGPSTLLITYANPAELLEAIGAVEGQLTACVHAEPNELRDQRPAVDRLAALCGRLIYNGFPTGVEVGPAMVHGGPYPATSDGRSTSVGTRSIARFCRPFCYQDMPDDLLPAELRNSNPRNIWRLIDGGLSKDPLR
jgi:alpha-ketoglutaric semialdehyde dehydrogenase